MNKEKNCPLIDEDEEDEEDMTEENELQYQTKMSELENLIAQNKLDYQSYVDIIQLSRKNADFNKLREYREKMSDAFPLTECK